MQQIRFKKLDKSAKIPTRNSEEDAGIDLYALEDTVLYSQFRLALCEFKNHVIRYVCGICNFIPLDFAETDKTATKIKTGIALEIPKGQYGRISDRSGLGSKAIKVFGGTIDSSYRGDITVCLMNFSFFDYHIKAGDRVAQIIIQKYEKSELIEADELSVSDRGNNGFGSSGR